MSKNIPTSTLSPAAVAGRDAEYPGTPLTDDVGGGTYADPYLGCNRAGSCAPGIGINTAKIDPKLQDWSIEDQHEDARSPQQSSHIAQVNAICVANVGLPAVPADIDILAVQGFGTDVNDTLSYSVADTQAAVDAEYDSVTGAINKTDKQVEIGDVLWGPIPVA
jgi:hypothetical protein